jgi:2-polyprenyl-3-methyl-5-hydroxy-6-metoxy-1,4-benzoquinol methylase
MPCVLCKSDEFKFLFEKNSFRIERCRICYMVQVTNMPPAEEVEEGYDENFYKTYYGDLEISPKKQRYEYLNFHNKLDQIERRITRVGKILDVGCSFGFFLDAARQRGWVTAGIDVSEYAASYAANRLGLEVVSKPILDAKFEESSFDVITMWYVIEHLPNPQQVLQYLANFLCEDGMLVVSTANVDSYLAKMQGRKWRMWIPPEHLLYFSPATIENLFKKCHLEVVDRETAVPYEKYLRKTKVYGVIDRLRLSDNIVYYTKKKRSHPAEIWE